MQHISRKLNKYHCKHQHGESRNLILANVTQKMSEDLETGRRVIQSATVHIIRCNSKVIRLFTTTRKLLKVLPNFPAILYPVLVTSAQVSLVTN